MTKIIPIRDLTALVVNQIQSPDQSMPTYARNKEITHELPGWIDELYLVFTLVYRHRWAAETDEVELATKHIWAKKLDVIDEKIIMETINECTSTFASWPPTPGEFLEIATSKARLAQEKRTYEARVRESHRLLEKRANPELAKQIMARLREDMRKKGVIWG